MRIIKKSDLDDIYFYQVPKWLMDLFVKGLISQGGFKTYVLMYDRTRLSAKNNWIDKEGYVYIKYSYDEMQSDLNCSRQTISNNLKDLVKCDLIDKVKCFSSSSIFYLKINSSLENLTSKEDCAQKSRELDYSSLENLTSTSLENLDSSNNNFNNNKFNKNNINNSTAVECCDIKLTKDQIDFRNKLTLFKEKISFKIREKKFNITPEDLLKYAGGDIELVERQFKHFSDKGLRYLVASIKGKYEEPKQIEIKEERKIRML